MVDIGDFGEGTFGELTPAKFDLAKGLFGNVLGDAVIVDSVDGQSMEVPHEAGAKIGCHGSWGMFGILRILLGAGLNK